MAEPLADRIIKGIVQAADLYHRLVIVAAPAGSGKTAALQDVHKRTSAPLVNVNLELFSPSGSRFYSCLFYSLKS